MLRYIKSLGWQGALAVSVMVVSGCVPLVVGAAAGVGGYMWVQGELVKEFTEPVEEIHDVTYDALIDLGLPISENRSDRISALVRSKFSDGDELKIHIEAITEKACRIKIRVGLFGDKKRSEFIYREIVERL